MSDDFALFIDESRENVESLEAGLVALEGSADTETALRELFRYAHNLKGMAATVGENGIASLAHRMEDILDLFRSGQATPSPDDIDALLAGADAIGALLDAAPSGAPAPPHLLTALEARRHALPAVASTPPVDAGDPGSGPVAGERVRIAVTLAPGAALPGARAAVVLRAIESRGTVEAVEPARELVVSGKATSFLVDAVLADAAAAIAKIRSTPDVAVVERVDRDEGEAPGGARARHTVRVEVERLDDLMNLVGELVIGRGQLDERIRNTGDRGLAEIVAGIGRTISDLQEAVGRVRMVTLESTFSRLQRLVRDTARDLGKEIRLTVSGGETELDRSMVDKVADPLVHLLRNALDHGIEPPAERTLLGKPPAGQVSLAAHTEGNQVVITVSDDGRGIDPDAVAARAVARGIISGEQAAAMSDADRRELIFVAGLSTRDEASAVSGRGVGMDVVRTSITSLGGDIDLSSAPGGGTTVRIRLPLSLAVLDVLLVSLAGQVWAIPLQQVEETIAVGADDVRGVLGRPVVTVRGETIPLVSGRRTIAGASPSDPPFAAVVFRHLGDRWALAVDALHARAEVVVKAAPREIAAVGHVAGATILGDGTVSMILDLGALVDGLAPGDLRHAS